MLRYLPGVVGAAGAFIALKLITLIDITALWPEVVIYGVAYLAITIAADRAMVRYGRHRPTGRGQT